MEGGYIRTPQRPRVDAIFKNVILKIFVTQIQFGSWKRQLQTEITLVMTYLPDNKGVPKD
jgi:hypothetical protein